MSKVWADTPSIPTSIDCASQLSIESGSVERVTDGDTIVLKDNRRVRLIGINTLELKDSDTELSAAAFRAKEALQVLLPKSEPVLLYVGTESHDRHNRLLAHVIRLKDHLAVAKSLLEAGHAMQSAVAPNTRCADYFAQIEQSARDQTLGVWQLGPINNTQASSISKKSRGFKVISGTVTNMKAASKNTYLTLDNKLRVSIRQTLLTNPTNGLVVHNLLGKQVEVRGWLSGGKNSIQLRLQHFANLRVLNN